jgi:hypothetical protein
MAKQTGIIPLVGTLDGINFYMRKGKPVARKAGGGFNGDKIKTSPKMVRVRENGSEFGHCSRVKKVFKEALTPFFKHYIDAKLHGRMMQLFLAIKDLDLVSERGKRKVLEGLRNIEGQNLLRLFVFTDMEWPLNVSYYEVNPTTLVISSFDTSTLPFSSNSTHLELCYGMVSLNFDTLQATFCQSDELRLTKNEVVNNVSLPLPNSLREGTVGVAVLQYRYMQELNDVFYEMKDGKSFGMKVVAVYGL